LGFSPSGLGLKPNYELLLAIITSPISASFHLWLSTKIQALEKTDATTRRN
jgi:hypothetical protein